MTFLFFFIFIGAAFAADRIKANRDAKEAGEEGEDEGKSNMMQVDFNAIELYRELVREKQGEKAANEAE